MGSEADIADADIVSAMTSASTGVGSSRTDIAALAGVAFLVGLRAGALRGEAGGSSALRVVRATLLGGARTGAVSRGATALRARDVGLIGSAVFVLSIGASSAFAADVFLTGAFRTRDAGLAASSGTESSMVTVLRVRDVVFGT